MLPFVKKLIEDEGVGEAQGSVGFAEVEYDAPDNAELGMRYLVRVLLSLVAGVISRFWFGVRERRLYELLVLALRKCNFEGPDG